MEKKTPRGILELIVEKLVILAVLAGVLLLIQKIPFPSPYYQLALSLAAVLTAAAFMRRTTQKFIDEKEDKSNNE